MFALMKSKRAANYSFSEIVKNGISLIYTKLFWKKARLIRLPAYVRGKKSIEYQEGLTLGYRCRLECNGKIEKGKLKIGKNCVLGDNVQIEANKSVTIGDNVLMASRVFISDTSHGSYSGDNQDTPYFPPNMRELSFKNVVIGNNVWVGENVSILPGVEIGDGSIISANSVVVKDVQAGCLCGGVPIKVLKQYDEKTGKWERKKNDGAYENIIFDSKVK